MNARIRIEQALSMVISRAAGSGCPPQLAAAMRYAVFPGGARVRPRLCLAVAAACGDDDPVAADAAAAAVELMHCASLVHDDLPCFDDASVRRGKPSLHRAFDERLAVLAGDALLALALQSLQWGTAASPTRLGPLLEAVAGAVAPPAGIIAGQAWEVEPGLVLSDYHRAKTGALFAAATVAGAVAAGAAPGRWRLLGACLGEAYQVADDIRDVAGDAKALGKPSGRDAALGRPSAAAELGLRGAVFRLRALVADAIDAIPACPGGTLLRELILLEAARLLPEELARRVA